MQNPPLDLSSALTLLGDAVSAEVVEALSGTGLRHSHGYVVQRLLVAPATATQIADELAVSQQAVSKMVRELVALGLVDIGTDPDDRRRRPVQLTHAGRNAVERARATRRSIDDRIRRALGELRFAETLAALEVALEALDLGDRVRRRAVSPPPGAWDEGADQTASAGKLQRPSRTSGRGR